MRAGVLGAVALLAMAGVGRAQDAKGPAALVGGQPIDRAAVDELIRPQLMDLRAQEQQLRTKALEALIAQELIAREAAARGISAEALEKAEVEDKAGIGDAEAKAYYAANKERLGALTEAEALSRIKEGLGRQRQNERRAAFARELRAKHEVQVLLEPYRLPVEVGGAPVRGNPEAAVTIVEFSDFQCTFCVRARASVAAVRQAYGDKVRWAFRHFPLGFHQYAEKAGEAASCAGEQGRFWEMHDHLWANSSKLAVEDLKAHAGALGLDRKAFDACLDSGRHAGQVQRDMEAGASYGVSGTPAFFVNGRPLVGAQPFEAFRDVIEDELRRARPQQASR
jgi:protein-disulfide isomerase